MCVYFNYQDRLKAWQNAIPGGDKLQKRHLICERHFKEKDIERYFKTPGIEGFTHCMSRDLIRLKKGAVPCLLLQKTNCNLQTSTKDNLTSEHVESKCTDFFSTIF